MHVSARRLRAVRYRVRITVPRRGGWREWATHRNSFEEALTARQDPPAVAAELESQTRRGRNYAKAGITATVDTTNIADAVAIAWDPFRQVAAEDLGGWDLAGATAEVRPEAPVSPGADVAALVHLGPGHQLQDTGASQRHMGAPVADGIRPSRHVLDKLGDRPGDVQARTSARPARQDAGQVTRHTQVRGVSPEEPPGKRSVRVPRRRRLHRRG